jgi:hypothetical protein
MESKIYTFRLSPGRDDHLISLLDSIPKGEMSVFIRQALRAFASTQAGMPTYVPINQPARVVKTEAPKQEATIIQDIAFELPPVKPEDQEVDLDSKMDALISNFL